MKTIENVAAARRGRLGWVLALLLAWAASPALGQVLPTNPNGTMVNPAVPIVRPDTATVRKPTKKQKREQAAADSARRTEKLFGLRLTKPAKAGFLAIAPGGGQIYNKKYWKLPIVYGLVGGLGYWIYYQQRLYKQFSFANGTVAYTDATGQLITRAKQITDSKLFGDSDSERQLQAQLATASTDNPAAITNSLISARRFRDLSILLSAVGYSLTVLDAVVDAHLSEFDVSDDLSLRWQPAALPVPGQAAFAPGLMLTLHARK
ncbi:hypothetical protein HHL22_20120 [Hymenobacter sp. RP-2-7]|uniref:DUF5683 domain-containing protein n=1 Tax=Hymenobacter polaris TaxID=2682546 RepID=A0A7Y0FPG1_9BACT|nr:DUF5683 domain-containing protein [Hymenobacter polaris]NML67515.1 hypothetical protein [Hymenobacter polaris]